MSRNLAKANADHNKLKLIERKGVVQARKIGAQLKASAVNAWRRKKDFALGDLLVKKLHPTFRDAMIAAHLRALQLNSERAIKKDKSISLSVFDDMLKKYKAFLDSDFDEIREYYDTQAFDILTGEAETVNSQMRETLYGLVAEGAHVKEGIEVLNNKIDSLGLGPQKDYRLETLFRTHTQMAFSAGKFQADQQPAIQEILWGYEYVTVGDDRVREDHIPLDGVRLRKEDPFWKVWYPPNGWNCRCQVIQIFHDDEEATENPPPDDTEIIQDKSFNFNPGEVVGPETRFKSKPPKTYVKKKKTPKQKEEEKVKQLKEVLHEEMDLQQKFADTDDKVLKRYIRRDLYELLLKRNEIKYGKPKKFAKIQGLDITYQGDKLPEGEKKKAILDVLKELEDFKDTFSEWVGLRKGEKNTPVIQLEDVEYTTYIDKDGLEKISGGLYEPSTGKIRVPLKCWTTKTTPKPTIGDRTVDESFLGACRHEMGHHIEYSVPYEKRVSWVNLCEKHITERLAPTSVSEYAATNEQERFAESFSAYTHKGYKRGALPRVIEKYMDTLLHGEEKASKLQEEDKQRKIKKLRELNVAEDKIQDAIERWDKKNVTP